MEYISTRGGVASISSKKVIIKGIAEDHGLFVPSSFPYLGVSLFSDIEERSYAARASKILKLFLTDFIEEEIISACKEAYSKNFDSPLTAPVRLLGNRISVLELWHGPTLAFKDIALQIMPRLLSSALRAEEESYKILILVATSGDTGKAALEGFADAERVLIFVFYPHEGVSEIQRLQMATQRGANVGVCGIIGNFDDSQTGVKQIFSDQKINAKLGYSHFRLSSANSINWGRLVPQIVYYFSAYEEMVLKGEVERGKPINICVPTGNFGNILAAYYAIQCGLPVFKLICASNINKVLTDFIRTGVYDRRREFHKTESPSMDILISSNLERLLFELAGRKHELVSGWMGKLLSEGWYAITPDALDQLKSLFYGGFADHVDTSNALIESFKKYGYLIDPHTAVGYSVLKRYQNEEGDSTPALLVSTASPFKFNAAVLEALGQDISNKDQFSLLERLSSLAGQPVPQKLAELNLLQEIHKCICKKEEMVDVIYKFLGIN